MSMYRPQKIQPKNGHTVVLMNVARISGCENQKDESLEDQQEHAREVAGELVDGFPVEYRWIATKGKGEDIVRPELAEVEAQLRTGEIDLLVLEDIGRLVRGTEASRLIGIAVDFGTRVVSPNDCIDTNDDSWEEDAISACRDHVGHNVHTSKRLKKKLMLRFKRNGQSTPLPVAGIIKPDDAKSYFDWSWDESSKPIILKGAYDLRQHLNCSAIADYFESVGFPTGKYCTNDEWDGKMVRRFYKNPILKGMPERGNMYSDKVHQTGRRRSKKNPEGPVSIKVPHLELLPPDEFDELKAALDEKNSNLGRKPNAKGEDPLKGIQRKRTRFPGQHAQCWYCGRQLVWGGNGNPKKLQCKGSRKWNCWNAVGFNGPALTGHVIDAINGMLTEVAGFDEQFQSIVQAEADVPDASLKVKLDMLIKDENQFAKESENFNAALREFGPTPGCEETLKDLKKRERSLLMRRTSLERKSIAPSDLPGTAPELVELLQSSFLSLATDSYEFGAMLPKIVPEIFCYLVRLVDGGMCYPRVKFKVDLAGSFESTAPDELQALLSREFTVDLFEFPKRARIRAEVVRLLGEGYSNWQVIEHFEEPLSKAIVASSAELDSCMKELGVVDPLKIQLEPPTDFGRMRRHRNPRYSFSMKEGYIRPEL